MTYKKPLLELPAQKIVFKNILEWGTVPAPIPISDSEVLEESKYWLLSHWSDSVKKYRGGRLSGPYIAVRYHPNECPRPIILTAETEEDLEGKISKEEQSKKFFQAKLGRKIDPRICDYEFSRSEIES